MATTYDGHVCYCPTGKIIENDTSCVWEQSCSRVERGLAPVCEQECKDLDKGQYACSCLDGFELVNGTRCKRKDQSTHYLYVVTTSSVLYQIKLPYTSPGSIESSHNLKAASSSFSIYSHQVRKLIFVTETEEEKEEGSESNHKDLLHRAELSRVHRSILEFHRIQQQTGECDQFGRCRSFIVNF